MITASPRVLALRRLLTDFAGFSRVCYPGRGLRAYQLEAAAPILAAIEARQGGSFTLLFSRQAGKDELLAQLLAFLLARYRLSGGAIVVAAPTYKPQCLVSRRRLAGRLVGPLHPGAGSHDGYIVSCGAASTAFLSAEESANVRGETASLLLIANEAQDIRPAIYDPRFGPMTASTNAPAVFSGTPWAAGSLLSRETATAAAAGTLYKAEWQRVAAEVPAYGAHVRQRIAQLGPQHPFILSEYGLQELDASGGLFSPRRQAQMHGTHARQVAGTPGSRYALLLDVAGEDEDAPADLSTWSRERRRDSMALTVVEVDPSTVKDDLLRKPTYRVVDRQEWVGQKHATLIPHLLDLARSVWRAGYFVLDATGLGAQVAGVIGAALLKTCEVTPFLFTQATKSDTGWGFLAAIESGRFKDYADDGSMVTRRYWAQVAACTYDVAPGPGKLMRWSVPEGRGHDDLLLSAALVAALDQRDWRPRMAAGRTRGDWQ